MARGNRPRLEDRRAAILKDLSRARIAYEERLEAGARGDPALRVSEGLRFVGVVYNLIAVGLVIMVFVSFLPRGLAGLRRPA